jgi:hypothetical protein
MPEPTMALIKLAVVPTKLDLSSSTGFLTVRFVPPGVFETVLGVDGAKNGEDGGFLLFEAEAGAILSDGKFNFCLQSINQSINQLEYRF